MAKKRENQGRLNEAFSSGLIFTPKIAGTP